MTHLAKYALWALFGALLGCANWHPWDSWQWWAWFFALMAGVYARDWAVRSNAELTGTQRATRRSEDERDN